MEKGIAIDIVLLPPKEIIDLCIPVNESSDLAQYISFKDGYVPHITISMVCIDRENLSKIIEEVEVLSKTLKPFDFTIDKIGFWKTTFGFDIEKTEELDSLYQKVSEILARYRLPKAEVSMFTEPEKVNPERLSFIEQFDENRKDGSYHPHITLGKERYENAPLFPIHFTSDTLAIFKLGPHYTCKNLLKEFKLL